jgi:WG containing repeat
MYRTPVLKLPKYKYLPHKWDAPKIKSTYINTQGKLITPPQFDRCEDFAEE